MKLTKCRRCEKWVDKYETIFGYCFECAKKLGAKPKATGGADGKDGGR